MLPSSPQVYVDYHDHLHGPDFRHFLIVHTHTHEEKECRFSPRSQSSYRVCNSVPKQKDG